MSKSTVLTHPISLGYPCRPCSFNLRAAPACNLFACYLQGTGNTPDLVGRKAERKFKSLRVNNFKKNYLKILEIGEKLSANNPAAGP